MVVVIRVHLRVGDRGGRLTRRVRRKAHEGDAGRVVRVAPQAPQLLVGDKHAGRDLFEQLLARDFLAVHRLEVVQEPLLLGHRAREESQVLLLVEPSVRL